MNLPRWAKRQQGPLWVYGGLGLALWPVPLLGLVHAEASAVVAGVSFFVSGFAALKAFRGNDAAPFGQVLGEQEGLLLVPLLLLTVTLLWRPNCDYLRGLLLYLAMPPVTVAFAVGLAYAISGLLSRYCKTTLVLTGVLVGVGGTIYDLGLHPQFYTYNHLFGGVLGPIYDRELALRKGFFFFRGLTLLWATFFFLLGHWSRTQHARRRLRYTATGAVVALLIGTAYFFSASLGFNTPAWRTQRVLGGHLQTAHFDIYYDPKAVSVEELAVLAEDHEWHYHRLEEQMGVAPDERIASYLYPNEEVKARLTGARRTSVAPVWLRRPQVHLLQQAFEDSFGHELVHAFSREFGLPVLNASRSVGLVEGLAVAFEPPTGRPSPTDQVSAAAYLAAQPGGAPPGAEGEDGVSGVGQSVAGRLSPLGFWSGRATVSYTTMGAFVRFLAERYGEEKLREVYAWGNFEEVYGQTVYELAEEWEEALLNQRAVARSAAALVERRFAQPSLFEVRCPHYVPPHRRAVRAGRAALAEGDTSRALAAFRRAVDLQPAFEAARVAAARLLLAQSSGDGTTHSRAGRALRFLRAAPDSSHGGAFMLAMADALALRGLPEAARDTYDRALSRVLPYRHETRALVYLRRALAGRPRLLAALLGGGSPLKRAARLRAVGGKGEPTVALLRATLLAAAERFASAARLLNATPPPSGLPSEEADQLVHRQRLVWAAQWTYRSGRPSKAKHFALEAARAYRRIGDRDAAHRWQTYAQKMQWVAVREAGKTKASLPGKGAKSDEPARAGH